MSIDESSNVPAVVSDFDSFALRQAVAGFLAGFGESTRQAYSLDLRQWMQWCQSHELVVFQAKRAHIELFARRLEEKGRASREDDVAHKQPVPHRRCPNRLKDHRLA